MTTSFSITRIGSFGKTNSERDFADAIKTLSMTTLGELSMKKTLLALAVLGAFAGVAHAQSSVTISGLIDMGYVANNPEGANNNSAGFDENGSATSTLVFSGTEDLGSGLQAGFFLQTNFAAGINNTTFLNAQNYVSLGGGFGTIKLGNINSGVMAASSASQPFGTAFGSGYSASFGRLDGLDISTTAADPTEVGAATDGARIIRTANSLYYTTPSFSGFDVTAGIALENDEFSATTGTQELGVSYKGNGLNAVLAYYKTTTGNRAVTTRPASVGVSGGAPSVTLADTIPANSDVTQTILGANYTFGPATVYAGWSQSDAGGGLAGDVDSTSYNVAGKFMVTPAIALMANYVKVNDKLAADQDRDLIGLGADYSLSKRTVAYVRYERGDYDKSAATGAGTGKFNTYAIGMRHSF
jgi:predicted porin